MPYKSIEKCRFPNTALAGSLVKSYIKKFPPPPDLPLTVTDTEGKERTVQGEGWDRGRGWDWERMSNVSLKLKTGTRGCQNFCDVPQLL